MRQCGLEDKLRQLGLNRPQIAAAVCNIIARMAHPGGDLARHAWLQQRSAAQPFTPSDIDEGDEGDVPL